MAKQTRVNRKTANYLSNYQKIIIKVILITFITILLQARKVKVEDICAKHIFNTGEYDIACVCSKSYCDKIQFDWPNQNEILVVETDKSGRRFETRTINKEFFSAKINSSDSSVIGEVVKNDTTSSTTTTTTTENILRVRLNPDKKMQKILGFGGSFTDAASYQFQTMSKQLRKYALQDYFGLDGLRYTIGRVPIAGSDFSSRPYTYVDIRSTQTLKEDFNLTRFKLQPEDIALKIPIIRQAQLIVQDSTDYKQRLNLIATSWSAPAWMKDNTNLVKGKLKGNSSLSFYEAYAKYHVKFLKEYKLHGIDFWGLTSQNEPNMAKSDKIQFNSMIFEPNELRDFIRDNLGPNLIKNGFGKDKLNLLIYDDNTDKIEAYVKSIANDTEAMKYVSGLAFHWYKRKDFGYSPLNEVRKLMPASNFIISTEASNIHGSKPGRWESGVEYAYDIIQTLRHYSIGWIDWNLALDMIGGPNWSENYVDAPILFDETKQIYYKNPMYYAMAHFTRFFEPQAQVIESEIQSTSLSSDDATKQQSSNSLNNNTTNITGETTTNYDQDDDVYVIASERPNKSHYSVVILNRSPHEKLIQIIESPNNNTLLEKLQIKANSITTLAIPLKSDIKEYFEDR